MRQISLAGKHREVYDQERANLSINFDIRLGAIEPSDYSRYALLPKKVAFASRGDDGINEIGFDPKLLEDPNELADGSFRMVCRHELYHLARGHCDIKQAFNRQAKAKPLSGIRLIYFAFKAGFMAAHHEMAATIYELGLTRW